MYSKSYCSDCFRAQHFFDEKELEYVEFNIEEDPKAFEKSLQLNKGMNKAPTILFKFSDGSEKVLIEPDRTELEEVAG
jgi:glutaredoxin